MSKNVPEATGNFNTIIQIFSNPCRDPWVGYAQLAAPALGKAAIKLLGFGMADVIRGATRPRGLRGSGPGLRGRRGGASFRGKVGRGIPEVGNMFGKKLTSDQFRGRQVGAGVSLMWEIDNVTQRLLWNFLIADVVDDFVTNWTSAILTERFCTRQYAQDCFRRRTGGTVSSIIGWQALAGFSLIWGEGGSFGHWIAGERGGFVGANLGGRPISKLLPDASLGLEIRTSSGQVQQQVLENQLGRKREAAVGAHLGPHESAQVRMRAFLSDYDDVSGSFTAASF